MEPAVSQPAAWSSGRPSCATLACTPPPRVGGVAAEPGARPTSAAPGPLSARRSAVMPHAALSTLLLLSLATATVAGKPPLPRPRGRRLPAPTPLVLRSDHPTPDHPTPISLAGWLPRARPEAKAKTEDLPPASTVSASSVPTPKTEGQRN